MNRNVPVTLVRRGVDPSSWADRLAIFEHGPRQTVEQLAPDSPPDGLYVFAATAGEEDLSAIRHVIRQGGAVLARLPDSPAAVALTAEAAREGYHGLSVFAPSVFSPACLEARRLLTDGTVGALRLLHHEMPLDDSQALFHRICTVVALSAPRWPDGPVGVSAAGRETWRIELSGGAVARLAAGPAGASGGTAACSGGEVRYLFSPTESVGWRLPDGTQARGALPDGDGALYQLLDAVDSWGEGRGSAIWPPAFARRTYELCTMLRRRGYPA